MQLTQKHAFWRITHQNRSNGLTPSAAKERTKHKKNRKTQTINNSPLRGDNVPEPTDMLFSVLTPDVIIPAKFYVDPLRGFWQGAPKKVPFPILFGTTFTTVLHYRADCNSFVVAADKWRQDVDLAVLWPRDEALIQYIAPRVGWWTKGVRPVRSRRTFVDSWLKSPARMTNAWGNDRTTSSTQASV